ncbi:hypothetical protein BOM25_13890 [Serratia sp. OPWLW2]|nr:hypothetical protein BOM25_13890 [Serratia sp. OPWLW2]
MRLIQTHRQHFIHADNNAPATKQFIGIIVMTALPFQMVKNGIISQCRLIHFTRSKKFRAFKVVAQPEQWQLPSWIFGKFGVVPLYPYRARAQVMNQYQNQSVKKIRVLKEPHTFFDVRHRLHRDIFLCSR